MIQAKEYVINAIYCGYTYLFPHFLYMDMVTSNDAILFFFLGGLPRHV